MPSCKKCGTENKANVKFCKACGTSMVQAASATNTCIACQAPLATGARFCKKCGAANTSASISGSGESALSSLDGVSLSAHLAAADAPAMPASSPPPEQAEQAAEMGVVDGPSHMAAPVGTDKPSRFLLPICAVLILLGIAGAGLYWWKVGQTGDGQSLAASPGKERDTAVPAAEIPRSLPLALPTPPVAPPSTEVHQTLPGPDNSTEQATRDTVAKVPPLRPAPAVKQRSFVAPPVEIPDVMAKKVSTLLARADGYISSRQYDKAIATAESALELAPGSAAATTMINKAKARQLEALKADSSLD